MQWAMDEGARLQGENAPYSVAITRAREKATILHAPTPHLRHGPARPPFLASYKGHIEEETHDRGEACGARTGRSGPTPSPTLRAIQPSQHARARLAGASYGSSNRSRASSKVRHPPSASQKRSYDLSLASAVPRQFGYAPSPP